MGKGLEMKYFVLKPKGQNIYAHASRQAMFVYAKVIEHEDPEFAKDIVNWANKEIQNG